MAVPSRSLWIAIPAGWAVRPAAIFPRPSSASVPAWASRSRSVPLSTHRRMASSNATIARIREECLAVDQPRDLSQAQAATEAFVEHYNVERPHQGLACGNRPPRTALPILPTLPPLPSTIDPDSWLQSLDGVHLERKIDPNGMLSIDLKRYSRLARTGGPSGQCAAGCSGLLPARLSPGAPREIAAVARSAGAGALL